MSRRYVYIGPDALLGSVSERRLIQSPQDVLEWIVQTRQHPEKGTVVATFIIDVDGQLWIADRHSEHVACAAGQPVLSAGEMTFALEGKQVSVTEVTNQSLGYCPEPSSWPNVTATLEQCGLSHPSFFTHTYILRVCLECGTQNIIKNGVYECGVCQRPLSPEKT